MPLRLPGHRRLFEAAPGGANDQNEKGHEFFSYTGAVTWQIPSISALRTFEAAARHMSFTKAAEELHVTQSAVSRQVAQTEEYLGLLLFQRVRKRLVLTQAGEQYAGAVRKALEQMQAATVALRGHKRAGGTLNIATGAAFATRWLIPRLARLMSRTRTSWSTCRRATFRSTWSARVSTLPFTSEPAIGPT